MGNFNTKRHWNKHRVMRDGEKKESAVIKRKMCLVAQSCLTLCDPMDCNPPGSSVPGDSPDKNTGVGCHTLLQGIFPTQGSNPGLLYCRQILYQQSHQGSLYVYKYLLIHMRRFIIGIGLHGYGA